MSHKNNEHFFSRSVAMTIIATVFFFTDISCVMAFGSNWPYPVGQDNVKNLKSALAEALGVTSTSSIGEAISNADPSHSSSVSGGGSGSVPPSFGGGGGGGGGGGPVPHGASSP